MLKGRFVTGKSHLIHLVVGIAGGVVALGLIMLLSMPRMMLVVHESRYNTVEETCSKLKESIEAQGWVCPSIRNMGDTIRKSGVDMKEDIRIVELCNAKHAYDVLITNPEVSTLMPCAWGVYKGEDGLVYISTMNMGLMGKIFGGNIAKVMAGEVARNEHDMLKAVIKL